MPPIRRSSLGHRTRNATNLINFRFNRTAEQREEVIVIERNILSQTRSALTQEERENEDDMNRMRRHRSVETNHVTMHLNNRLRRPRNVVLNTHRAAFRYNLIVDYSADQSVDIGSMSVVCRYCKALKYKNEAPGLCCASGKIKLEPLVPPPEPLLSLVSGTGTYSKHFLSEIQKYNSCFQMTSFGATNVIRDNCMPTFKIQGQIYHRAGSLMPPQDADYKFLQIYFMGNTQQEVDQRCTHNTSVKIPIVEQLQTTLKIKLSNSEAFPDPLVSK